MDEEGYVGICLYRCLLLNFGFLFVFEEFNTMHRDILFDILLPLYNIPAAV